MNDRLRRAEPAAAGGRCGACAKRSSSPGQGAIQGHMIVERSHFTR